MSIRNLLWVMIIGYFNTRRHTVGQAILTSFIGGKNKVQGHPTNACPFLAPRTQVMLLCMLWVTLLIGSLEINRTAEC